MRTARTLALLLLTTVVAVRLSSARPVDGVFARTAGDPVAALETATTGWSTAGTVGEATAQPLRELPVAATAWLADILGLAPGLLQAGWHVGVLALAALGALRLARFAAADQRVSLRSRGLSWSPWVGAGLYACGPVVVATTLASPTDGLVAASLPWLVAPLVSGARGWRPAAASAAWLGLAGLGSPLWAVAAVVAGVVAAVAGSGAGFGPVRGRAAQLGRWLVLSCLASAWWVVALVWEAGRASSATDVVAAGEAADRLGAALGVSWPLGWLLLVVAAPVVVALAAAVLVLRGRVRAVVVTLLVASGAALLALAAGWRVPVLTAWVAGRATTSPAPSLAPVLAPVLAWTALAGLLSWVPLTHRVLVPGLAREGAAGRVRAVGLAGLVVTTSALGFVSAVREPPDAVAADDRLWDQVAAWSQEALPGRVLVLPAVEGQRLDPAVAQALGGRSWTGRDPLPGSGAGATNALDDAVRRLSRGLGGPGTTTALARLGISYVLLRNDVPLAEDRHRPAALVRHALHVGGAARVAVLTAPDAGRAREPVTDVGVRGSDSVEIWSLGPPAAQLYPTSPVRVAGAVGAVGDLADAGLAAAPVELVDGEASRVDVLSDSARRRDVDQRQALDPSGPTLTEEATPDLVPGDAAGTPTATRRVSGVSAVAASSSAADVDGSLRRAGTEAVSALDGNAFTSWQSRSGAVVEEWWELVLERPTDLTGAAARLVVNPFSGQVVTRVRIVADSGEAEVDVPAGGVVSLAPAGVTTRVRIVATAAEGDPSPGSQFGISEVSVPGVTVEDQLVVAGPDASGWVLAARPGSRATCVPAAPTGTARTVVTTCDPRLVVPGADSGPLERVLRTAAATPVTGSTWLRAAATGTTASLADTLADPTVRVTASSVAAADLTTRPQAAADDDPATAWRPAVDDGQPTLTLTWARPATVSAVRLVAPKGPASTPTRVRVTPVGTGTGTGTATGTGTGADGGAGATVGDVEADVRADGMLRFPAVRTTGLRLTVLEDSATPWIDSLTGATRALPVAVAEVEVTGGPETAYAGDAVRTLPCGEGPNLSIDGEPVPTTLTVTPRELVSATVLRARLCGRPSLPGGATTVVAAPSSAWVPLGVVLSAPGGRVDARGDDPPGPDADLLPLDDGVLRAVATGRLELPGSTGERTLVLPVPAGRGWTARSAGDTWEPVVVDGWAQGWLVPDGAADVVLGYSPTGTLRAGVAVAVTGWLVVVAVSLLGPRARSRRRDHAIAGRSTQA